MMMVLGKGAVGCSMLWQTMMTTMMKGIEQLI